jgi:hypothetical protein
VVHSLGVNVLINSQYNLERHSSSCLFPSLRSFLFTKLLLCNGWPASHCAGGSPRWDNLSQKLFAMYVKNLKFSYSLTKWLHFVRLYSKELVRDSMEDLCIAFRKGFECIVCRFFFFLYFGSTRVWTQGLLLLCRCSTTWAASPSSFCVSYFSNRVWCLRPGWPSSESLPFTLPVSLGWQACTTMLSFYWFRWVLWIFCQHWPGTSILSQPPEWLELQTRATIPSNIIFFLLQKIGNNSHVQ